jgi:hypothetical protein
VLSIIVAAWIGVMAIEIVVVVISGTVKLIPSL